MRLFFGTHCVRAFLLNRREVVFRISFLRCGTLRTSLKVLINDCNISSMRKPGFGTWVWPNWFSFSFSYPCLRHSCQRGVWLFKLLDLEWLVNKMLLDNCRTCFYMFPCIKMHSLLILLFGFIIESYLKASGAKQLLLRNSFLY